MAVGFADNLGHLRRVLLHSQFEKEGQGDNAGY